MMIGNAVISEVDDLKHVVISMAGKSALWGISWYH